MLYRYTSNWQIKFAALRVFSRWNFPKTLKVSNIIVKLVVYWQELKKLVLVLVYNFA
jgi:hypothetical protein